ncbi:sulfate ABC transporter permease subunit CysT [Aureimonas fodinaquatilis]|uniref:Sulfate transport system permease protein CysT n=1 Tax=Aureimonas fodinaquatilis TaxID=2565783 RepID=A0A5B0E1Q7_9HYPH|nr:sulfate ABC transporter permease subunit CysT [Aureimonas fodinaquatilis]KAA0972232.1 sulfate ABC transporter permease subunit CysT [Aureimonas fodinaquatilis]
MAGRFALKKPSVVPGFGLAMGFTLSYLSLLVLLPLAALLFRSFSIGWSEFWAMAASERVFLALRLSFVTSFIAAAINAVFGFLVAWVLVRYQFPGRRIVDAVIDLPFALPTAVAGIALTALYAPNGWVGQMFAPGTALGSLFGDGGLRIAYTPLGIVVALTFVSLPFVVRTVQPVLEEFDSELEQAAATLGANRWQIVRKVVFPSVLPALMTGFALALARSVGEYGSVIFIAGNIPYVSEIAPLLIVIRLEEFNYGGATVVAALMLGISFLMLLVINLIQAWSRRRFGHVA